jgi:excisionase family DNA binding protein
MEEKTYTTKEVASRVGVSYQTLHNWIDAKRIPAPRSVRVGKKSILLWAKADMERAQKLRGTLKAGRTKKK